MDPVRPMDPALRPDTPVEGALIRGGWNEEGGMCGGERWKVNAQTRLEWTGIGTEKQ